MKQNYKSIFNKTFHFLKVSYFLMLNCNVLDNLFHNPKLVNKKQLTQSNKHKQHQASALRGLPSGPDGAQPGAELRGEKWAFCWEKWSRGVRCRSNASAILESLRPTALSHPCGLRADVEAEHNSECCLQHWWSGVLRMCHIVKIESDQFKIFQIYALMK